MIEFGPESYIVGQWFIHIPFVKNVRSEGDAMGVLQRNPKGWLLQMRTRLYASRKIFDHQDEKRWVTVEIPKDEPEAKVKERVDGVFELYAKLVGGKLEYAPVNGGVEEYMKIAQSGKYSWLHVKVEKKGAQNAAKRSD